MFKQLLITEFQTNKHLLGLWLLAVLFFFTLLGLRGNELEAFMGASLLCFWVLLITSAVIAGDEKRDRLYAELPVTTTEAFLASWSFVLSWIGLLVLAWLAFGVLFDPAFNLTQASKIAIDGIGVAVFILFIAIAIDLGRFRPAYVRWLYIGLLVAGLGLAVHLDVSIGVISDQQGFHVFPIALMEFGVMSSLLSIGLFVLLMLIDYYVYTRADDYTR